jgi:SAM-dependent methyltransferase
MHLPESRFDGVFANASLFHVPSQEIPKVLLQLLKTLKPRGVLFSSNPRGNNEEGLSDDRYACFFDLDTWRDYVTSAGFVEVGHYYRPQWDCRGISSRGWRPFGAKASQPGRAVPPIRPAMSRLSVQRRATAPGTTLATTSFSASTNRYCPFPTGDRGFESVSLQR